MVVILILVIQSWPSCIYNIRHSRVPRSSAGIGLYMSSLVYMIKASRYHRWCRRQLTAVMHDGVKHYFH